MQHAGTGPALTVSHLVLVYMQHWYRSHPDREPALCGSIYDAACWYRSHPDREPALCGSTSMLHHIYYHTRCSMLVQGGTLTVSQPCVVIYTDAACWYRPALTVSQPCVVVYTMQHAGTGPTLTVSSALCGSIYDAACWYRLHPCVVYILPAQGPP